VLDGFHIGLRREVRIETAKGISAAEPSIVAMRHFGRAVRDRGRRGQAVNVVVG
jgi:hypothetical protein